jgi:hypothetical protein
MTGEKEQIQTLLLIRPPEQKRQIPVKTKEIAKSPMGASSTLRSAKEQYAGTAKLKLRKPATMAIVTPGTAVRGPAE